MVAAYLVRGACLVIATGLFAIPASADDTERGRTLAQAHCARCHAVPGLDTMTIGMTLSFEKMARTEILLERFPIFYTLLPHPSFVRIEGVAPWNDLPPPMAPIHLTPGDVDDIAAYARELARD